MREVSDQLARAIDRMMTTSPWAGSMRPCSTPRFVALQAEREALEARLAASAAPEVATLRPKALERSLAAIEALQGQLSAGLDAEAVGTLRGLIASLVTHPREAGEPIDLKGGWRN